MRVTGPTVRRNQAWLEMRMRKKERELARRQAAEAEEESDAGTSGDDEGNDSSDGGVDTSDEEGPGPVPTPRPAVGSGGVGVVLNPLPGSAQQAVESGDEDSDGEPAQPPAAGTTTTGAGLPAATGAPSAPNLGETPGAAPVGGVAGGAGTASGAEVTGVGEASPLPSPSGGTQADVLPPGSQADGQGGAQQLSAEPQSNMNTGAAVGIVFGVLAIVGIMIAGAFLYRRWRRNRGDEGGDHSSLSASIAGRFHRLQDKGLGGAGGGNQTYAADPVPGALPKTNTAIMDSLMKAAYAADGGANDMESRASGMKAGYYANGQSGAFFDEKAYAALAGPMTPRSERPVSKWLNNVKTPRSSQGDMPPLARMPSMPPQVQLSSALPPQTPEMPYVPAVPAPAPAPISRMPPMPRQGNGMPPPAAPDAYRETMKTETTATDVRWYG